MRSTELDTFSNICLALLSAASHKPPKWNIYGGMKDLFNAINRAKIVHFSTQHSKNNCLKCLAASLKLESLSEIMLLGQPFLDEFP